MKIAIIGSGMAGLACARYLTDAGVAPVVFDKGRGLGGRMATRRAGALYQFDHGAQVIPCDSAAFGRVLDQARAAGAVADWCVAAGQIHAVGTPGMTGLAKFLADGIPLHQGTQVTSVMRSRSAGWDLAAEAPLGRFDRVICTAPAPQTAALVGHALPCALDPVSYAPSLTLMVALHRPLDAPAVQSRPTEPLAWIAQDSAKPDRPSQQCWVAQASAQWSATHLERDRRDIAARMLDLFLSHTGLAATDVAHVAAHRWRYARVTQPLGQPYVTSHDGTLCAAGDWCLGPHLEHAWHSGTRAAEHVLASL